MDKRTRAFKLKRVESTADFGSDATYSRDGSFLCAWEALSAAANVLAGKDHDARRARFWFDPREITLAVGDKIVANGREYIVDYAYAAGVTSVEAYVEGKAISAA